LFAAQGVSMDAAAWAVPVGFFATIAVLVYIIGQQRTRREALRAELHAKLLERVSSANFWAALPERGSYSRSRPRSR
jgi:hypothetical protein